MNDHVVGELGTTCVPKKSNDGMGYAAFMLEYNICANNSFLMVAQIVVEHGLRIADVFCVLRSGAGSFDGKSEKAME